MSGSTRLEVAATFARLEQAEMAAAILLDEGIAAAVPDRGIIGVNPLLVGAVGYARVLVPAESLAAARELLEAAGLLGGDGGANPADLEAEALAAEPDESTRGFLAAGEGDGPARGA